MRICLVLAFVRTLIHIGLPRTASTFFQNNVFSSIEGFEFIGVEHTFFTDTFQKILYQDDSLYKESEIRDSLQPWLEKNIILSNELFIGQSIIMNSGNRTRTALRLNRLFPNAEIILMIRNQVSLLKSLYALAVYGGHFRKPNEFIRFEENEPRYNTFEESEHVESFLLTPLVQLYAQNFDKLSVFVFEEFSVDPKGFVARLLQELRLNMKSKIDFEKKENRSISNRQIAYFRILNRWKPLLTSNDLFSKIFRQKVRFGERFFAGGKAFAFNEEIEKKLHTYYENDNLMLLKELPFLKESQIFKEKYFS